MVRRDLRPAATLPLPAANCAQREESRHDAFFRRWVVVFTVLVGLVLAGFSGGIAFAAEEVELQSIASTAPLFKVAENGAYFVGHDGNPVLWLADTWWFCPSTLCPFDTSSNPAISSMFRALVDLRAAQGFNAVQMAFLGPTRIGGKGLLELYTKDSTPQERREYWDDARRYIRYANSRGLVVAVGVGWYYSLDTVDLARLKALWGDVVAELGEFNVIWFIAGEYNAEGSQARMDKVASLIGFIRTADPRHHLLTLHPAHWNARVLQVGDATPLDFVMVQGGHTDLPPVSIYAPRRMQDKATGPVVEAECHYEGILGATTEYDVRACMIRALLSGAAGFSYGAHGLWYPVQSPSDQKFKEWGAARPWWQAMKFPGADAVGRTKRFFEGIQWWKMEPHPGAILAVDAKDEASRPRASMEGNSRVLVWFPKSLASSAKAAIQDLQPGSQYSLKWIPGDLRTTEGSSGLPVTAAEERFTALPNRPSSGDWFLLMQRINASE